MFLSPCHVGRCMLIDVGDDEDDNDINGVNIDDTLYAYLNVKLDPFYARNSIHFLR